MVRSDWPKAREAYASSPDWVGNPAHRLPGVDSRHPQYLGGFPAISPTRGEALNPHFDESENKTPDASYSRQQPIAMVVKSGSITLENFEVVVGRTDQKIECLVVGLFL
jgi:hypothetical protein